MMSDGERYAFQRRRSTLKRAADFRVDCHPHLGISLPLSTLSPEDCGKVPAAMQNADDFDRAVSDPKEDHMRANNNRP